jgi:predicted permease
MGTLLQDVAYAWRQLKKSPGFAFVAVLTLALGIGANTAIFSVMNALVLRYLPVPNPQQLFFLHTTGWPSVANQTGEETLSFNKPSFDEVRDEHAALSDLIAYVPLGIGKITVRLGEEPEEATADMVSGNFFSGLGVTPARGRLFAAPDETAHSLVAVLSYNYWTRRFARSPSVLGQTLYIKTVPFTIIGVASQDFTGIDSEAADDVWIPLQDRHELPAWGNSDGDGPGRGLYDSPNWWCLMLLARLKVGVTEKQAVAQLNPIFQRAAYSAVEKRDPKEHPPNLYLTPARGLGANRESLEQPLTVLMGMVGLVLLIACINVAMLLLARNSARTREFSVRMALGASRGRLFRQLLAESLLLVAAGAVVAWVFTGWATRALAAWAELDTSLAPDSTVLVFAAAVSLATALAFGLAPLRSAVRVPPGLALKTSVAVASEDRRKIRGGQIVVALQMALCLVLLVAAGLLLRTLRNLENANLGMRVSGLITFGIIPPPTLQKEAEVMQFYRTLTDRLRVLPGVESVTLMGNRIGSGWSNNTEAIVDGHRAKASGFAAMRWNNIGPDYFHVLETPMVLGRDFTDGDTSSAPKVAIVNETFVKKYLEGLSPLGHHIAVSTGPGSPQFAIVGVAADSRYTSVQEGSVPMAYLPYTQIGAGTMHFEVRSQGSPGALFPEVRRAVRESNPDIALLQPMTQEEQFQQGYNQQRLFARCSIFFGLLAALLVATGLYGTLAYRVSRRTAEIGVRMALGAQRRQVLWMVLRESLAVTAAGVIVGLPLAIVIGRALRAILFGLGPADPVTFAAALAGMALVTLIASLIPARRAASVDPMQALRTE